MRGMWLFGAAITLLLVAAPDDAFGQKKDKGDGDIRDANASEYALLAKFLAANGVLLEVDAEKSTISVRVPYAHKVKDKKDPKDEKKDAQQDQKLQKEIQQLQQKMEKNNREIAQAKGIKDPGKRNNVIGNNQRENQQIAAHIQKLRAIIAKDEGAKYHTEHDFLDFDLKVEKTAALRKLPNGVEFDDKGNPKPAPKSKDGLPGVPITWPDLAPGLAVSLKLSAPKAPETRPTVRVLLVTGEGKIGKTKSKKSD